LWNAEGFFVCVHSAFPVVRIILLYAFRRVCEALCAEETWIAELFEPLSAQRHGAKNLTYNEHALASNRPSKALNHRN
jgi:hypothetical protein